MKQILLISLLLTLSGSAMAQLPSAMEVGSRMYPGWNLGNTLEAGDGNTFSTNASGNLNYETYWQSTTTTQAVIDFVKAQGFRSVRIPCAWMMGHVYNNTEVTVHPDWMKRVREIVDYCINDDLYVVLNDHWDGGWLENNLAAYNDETARQLKSLWTQIANEFKDYDEHLLFAGFNEPDCNVNNQPNAQRIAALEAYEQDFVDAVRATGGNNASRILVVQAPSTSIEHACNYLHMPTDVIEGHIMVEVHYYTPPQFTGVWENNSPIYFWGTDNHVPSGTYTKYNATWGEEDYLYDQLKMMYDHYTSKGCPVILGEYGANWRNLGNAAVQKKHDASIKLFNHRICEYAINHGAVPFVWDINVANQNGTGGIMTIIDRNTLSVFCPPAMEGILEGTAEATWPSSSDIEQIEITEPVEKQSSQLPTYNLWGQPTTDSQRGFVIREGKLILR